MAELFAKFMGTEMPESDTRTSNPSPSFPTHLEIFAYNNVVQDIFANEKPSIEEQHEDFELSAFTGDYVVVTTKPEVAPATTSVDKDDDGDYVNEMAAVVDDPGDILGNPVDGDSDAVSVLDKMSAPEPRVDHALEASDDHTLETNDNHALEARDDIVLKVNNDDLICESGDNSGSQNEYVGDSFSLLNSSRLSMASDVEELGFLTLNANLLDKMSTRLVKVRSAKAVVVPAPWALEATGFQGGTVCHNLIGPPSAGVDSYREPEPPSAAWASKAAPTSSPFFPVRYNVPWDPGGRVARMLLDGKAKLQLPAPNTHMIFEGSVPNGWITLLTSVKGGVSLFLYARYCEFKAYISWTLEATTFMGGTVSVRLLCMGLRLLIGYEVEASKFWVLKFSGINGAWVVVVTSFAGGTSCTKPGTWSRLKGMGTNRKQSTLPIFTKHLSLVKAVAFLWILAS